MASTNRGLTALIGFDPFSEYEVKTMAKEVETAGEIANPEVSGGLQGTKEAVYNFLGNFFEWLSTHQGVTIFLIICVLGLIIWLMLRAQKFRRQAKNEAYLKKKEIEKKDKLIEEQETKLTNLQKKMDDQQAVVSEAMLGTLRTLTGYGADQLPIFFKSLTQISGNPLQVADQQVPDAPEEEFTEEDSDDSIGINDSEEMPASDEDVDGEDASEDSDAKDELTLDEDSSEPVEKTEKLESEADSSESGAAKEEEIDSGSDSYAENDSKDKS
jgi:hypothetical protein